MPHQEVVTEHHLHGSRWNKALRLPGCTPAFLNPVGIIPGKGQARSILDKVEPNETDTQDRPEQRCVHGLQDNRLFVKASKHQGRDNLGLLPSNSPRPTEQPKTDGRTYRKNYVSKALPPSSRGSPVASHPKTRGVPMMPCDHLLTRGCSSWTTFRRLGAGGSLVDPRRPL